MGTGTITEFQENALDACFEGARDAVDMISTVTRSFQVLAGAAAVGCAINTWAHKEAYNENMRDIAEPEAQKYGTETPAPIITPGQSDR